MQQYRSLFDKSEQPAKLSRKSDPITSQQSAAETEPRSNTLQFFVFDAIRKQGEPMTANEAAIEAAKQYVAAVETFRKRVRELVRLNLIEEAGERRCEITGKNAMTFRVRMQK